MPARRFPHEPSPETLQALEDQYLQDLVNYRTVRKHALASNQTALVGDFAPIALGLAWLAWRRGRSEAEVAEFAGDAVRIALAAVELRYVFRSPYDYWLLTCAAVALEHPAAPALLTMPTSQWARTPRGRVAGMLPGAVIAMAAATGAAGDPDAAVRSFQQLLRAGLDTPDDREEALRFAPTVGALAAVQMGRASTWATACTARQDGWLAEARRFPDAPMFLLDWEWLAVSRLARDAGFPLPEDDVYRPQGLLEAAVGEWGSLGDRLGPP